MWTDSPDAITKCRFFSKEFVRRVNLYTDRLLSTKDKLCRKNTDLLMLKQTLCSVTIVIQRVNDAFVIPKSLQYANNRLPQSLTSFWRSEITRFLSRPQSGCPDREVCDFLSHSWQTSERLQVNKSRPPGCLRGQHSQLHSSVSVI